MTAKWPEELPQYVDAQSFQGTTSGAGAIRDDVGAGPAYQRPRYTAVVDSFAISFYVTKAQYSVFKAFWKDSILGGTQDFTWVDPETQEAATVQFDVSKGYTRVVSGQGLMISATLEVLP